MEPFSFRYSVFKSAALFENLLRSFLIVPDVGFGRFFFYFGKLCFLVIRVKETS